MNRKQTNANTDPRGKKTKIDTIRRTTCEKKTTLSYLRNKDWRIVKSENEKVNDLLTNISTKDITGLNDLICTKLVGDKIGVPLNPQIEIQNPGENSDLNHR